MSRYGFRVWDKKSNVMVYDDLGAYCNCDEGMTLCYDDCVLMQCTGLKDKNGRDIYEGDIYHQGDPNITYTVVWFDTGLVGKQNNSTSYSGLSHWRDKIEVIGNIYQNSKLK